MEFSKYAVFLKVVEFGSMSECAVYCNYSQSAVSQIISSLEKELQVTLLNRNQSGVWLTSYGKHLLPYIKQLQAAEAAVYEQSAQLRGVETGIIRIGTFSSISCHVLMPAVKAFKEKYPNIKLEIREGDNLAIESWLAKGTVDFGFVDAPTLRGFETIEIHKDPFVCVIPNDSPYKEMPVIPIDVFEKEPIVLFDEGTNKEAAGILRRSKIKPNVAYTSRDDNLILSMIGNNLCLGFMGLLILKNTSYNVTYKKTKPQFYRNIVLAIRNRDTASNPSRKFVDFFEDYIKTEKIDFDTL